jgi:hypothetical protein
MKHLISNIAILSIFASSAALLFLLDLGAVSAWGGLGLILTGAAVVLCSNENEIKK